MEISAKYNSILIDSGGGWFANNGSEHSCLALGDPDLSFSATGKDITIQSGPDTNALNADPLELLDDFLSQGYTAIGYIGYEYSKYTMEGFVPKSAKDGSRFPDMNFLLYKHINTPCADNLNELTKASQSYEIIKKTSKHPHLNGHVCFNMTKYQYMQMINKGKCYIEQGDIYQANLSQRMMAQVKKQPLNYFLDYYHTQQVPFGCYLDFGDYQLLSGSMELFLRKSGNKLTTNPIKGTIKRGATDEIDAILKAKLISSDKERAENLMIVDLMRNDLGKVSKIGSVKVNRLFDVETYTTLHQMVSEIESEVDQNIKVSQIVNSTFPPGSVTGAPKKRTLEVIDELEPHLRGPYCGVVGIFYPNLDFVLSVAIRVIVTSSDRALFYVGGGIVWDSDPQREYEETILKSQATTKALGIDL